MVRRFWMGVQGKHRGYFECAKNANEFRTTTKLLANKRRKNWLSFCTNLYGSGEKKGHETVEIRKDTGEAVRAAFCLPISKTETQKAEPAGSCWPSLPGLNIPSTQKKRKTRSESNGNWLDISLPPA